jgi:hypothetical protein
MHSLTQEASNPAPRATEVVSGPVIVGNSGRDTVTDLRIVTGLQTVTFPKLMPGDVISSTLQIGAGSNVKISYMTAVGILVSDAFSLPQDRFPLLVVVQTDGQMSGISSRLLRLPVELTAEKLPSGSQLSDDLASGDVDSSLIKQATVYCLPNDSSRIHSWRELSGLRPVTEVQSASIAQLLTDLYEAHYHGSTKLGPVEQQGIVFFELHDGRTGYFQFQRAATGIVLMPPSLVEEFGVHEVNVGTVATLGGLMDQACRK